MERRVSEFIAQALANTARAFATATQSEAALFAALARAVERRVSESIAQALANTAWACVTAGWSDAALLAALARAAGLCIGAFSVQELADVSTNFEFSPFEKVAHSTRAVFAHTWLSDGPTLRH